MVAGIVIILSSVPAGVTLVDTDLVEPDEELASIISDRIIVGQFVSGVLPILWVGIGSILAGILLSNWLAGTRHQISDTLRLVVLAALYPTVAQFTNILIHDESSFTLIPPLLAGLAVTLVTAVVLFKLFRRQKDEEQNTT